MTRRRLTMGALLGLAAVAVAVGGPAQDTTTPGPRTVPAARPVRTPAATAVHTPAPPQRDLQALDRQDRADARRRRREATAFDRRPLLSHLPLRLAGMAIAIAGLAADERTTILAIAPGPRTRAEALALYRRALRVYGDPGTAYQLRWQP